MGTPQELTNECGEVVWCNYEWAWGGRYTHFYKEQFLNDCAIIESDLQPIRFQGQFYDVETGLHYNRFRYYDSDVGMFIQRDPIGLLGGSNVFAYAPNPVGWVDPWGLNRCPWSSNMNSLEKNAHDIHGEVLKKMDGTYSNSFIGFNSSTIAIAKLKDSQGKIHLVSASSRGYLTKAQKSKSEALGIKPLSIPKINGVNGHAERNIIDRYASNHGMQVIDIAASRPICCSCHEAIKKHGANPVSPLKKKGN